MEKIDKEKLMLERQLRKAERERKKQEIYAWHKKESKKILERNKQQQTSIGITHYTWSGIDDGRCCEGCLENNGKIFAWDTPPEKTGHPGEGKFCTDTYGCRCVPLACINIDEKNTANQNLPSYLKIEVKSMNEAKASQIENVVEVNILQWDSRFLKDRVSYWIITLFLATATIFSFVSLWIGGIFFFWAFSCFIQKKKSFNKIVATHKSILLIRKNNTQVVIKLNDIYSLKKVALNTGMIKIDNTTYKNIYVRFYKAKHSSDFIEKITALASYEGGFCKKPYNTKRNALLTGAMMGAFYAIFRR